MDSRQNKIVECLSSPVELGEPMSISSALYGITYWTILEDKFGSVTDQLYWKGTRVVMRDMFPSTMREIFGEGWNLITNG